VQIIFFLSLKRKKEAASLWAKGSNWISQWGNVKCLLSELTTGPDQSRDQEKRNLDLESKYYQIKIDEDSTFSPAWDEIEKGRKQRNSRYPSPPHENKGLVKKRHQCKGEEAR